MSKRRLTDREMLRGVEKALSSSKTPSHLQPGLRRLRERLQARLSEPSKKDFLSRLFGL